MELYFSLIRFWAIFRNSSVDFNILTNHRYFYVKLIDLSASGTSIRGSVDKTALALFNCSADKVNHQSTDLRRRKR
jgi:hypothetical protein